MTEIDLGEGGEENLKRAAQDAIFLAFLSSQISRDPQPARLLREIREAAIKLEEAAEHSADPEVNAYCQRHVGAVIHMYLDQLKIEEGGR